MEMQPNAISLAPLPPNQDFTALKATALDFIQSYSETIWSNLNPSDPGITILDQVCFALTELGYCGDFSVPDLLTPEDGKLKADNQFYLPEKIMTTSPVTTEDYRKYIIDGVAGVAGLVLQAVNSTYRTYLLIDSGDVADTCKAVYYYLNKARNLGERFFKPKTFRTAPLGVTGKVTISDTVDQTDIIKQIAAALQDFQLPAVKGTGYEELLTDGWDAETIFNGPILKNGWIPGDAGYKKDGITLAALNQLIMGVPGVLVSEVVAVEKWCMVFSCSVGELLVIDFSTLTIESKSLPAGTQLPKPVIPVPVAAFLGAAHGSQTTFTGGTYRDIQNYYSIQNTFPEAFAVGANAITANATSFQIAQSRQLKGYLTLFDQVIANQFAQLAGVQQLFSFKNAGSGTPRDEHAFYALKDEEEKEHLEYPVPYQDFSPTYFYQSLYEVPHIRALLKDNDALKFSIGLTGKKDLEHQSWLAYRQDPYNAYMRGMASLMADEPADMARRNDMLNHLLARHGESHVLLDTLINGSAYTGDPLKDRIIIKSLLLQNLDLLSYHRYRGYNCVGAGKLSFPLSKTAKEGLDEQIAAYANPDFLPDTRKIDGLEKLTPQDFNDYAGIELQINLLLGLKSRYARAMRKRTESQMMPGAADEVLRWMVVQRKGMILIESALLWKHIDMQFLLQGEGSTYTITQDLNVTSENIAIKRATQIDRLFRSDAGGMLVQNAVATGYVFLGNDFYWVNEIDPVNLLKAQSITGTEYCFSFQVTNGEEIGSLTDNPALANRADVIFPQFLEQQAGLPDQVDLLLEQNLPLAMTGQCHFLPLPQDAPYGPVLDFDFATLITDFINWHNTLARYERNAVQYPSAIRPYAGVMLNYLLRFKLKGHE
jgi:hypothetical protein